MPRGLTTLIGIVLVAGGLAAGAWWWGSHARSAGGGGAESAGTNAGGNRGGGGTSASGPVVVRSEGLRVMAANVRMDDPKDGKNGWPQRRDLLVKTLLKYNMDVIGCQEVTPPQGAFLIRELKGYGHYPRGKAENNGKTTGLAADIEGTFSGLNTVFYREERLEFVDGANGLVIPEALQDRPAENTFYALCVLKDRADKVGEVIVVNTHLRHDEKFATRCAAKLRAIIATWQAKYPSAGVVVMGDMNHDKGSAAYAMLTQGGKIKVPGEWELRDTFDYGKRGKEMWGNWHEYTGKARRALPTDLIFVSERLGASAAEIVRDGGEGGVWPSDHFFVWTEVGRK